MSELTLFPDLVQGSAEWLEARAGLVTASTVGKLLTPTLKVADNDTSRGLITTLAAERITGTVEYVWPNADMRRGVEHEPYAREAYTAHHAEVVELGFMTRQFDGFKLGFSPDGLVGADGLIEIKSPRAKAHIQTILHNRVPPWYMAQCQTGLLVSGRKWLDFVSFCAGMPLYVKRVLPDKAWHNAIVDAARAANTAIDQIITRYTDAVRGLHPTERIPEFEDIRI